MMLEGLEHSFCESLEMRNHHPLRMALTFGNNPQSVTHLDKDKERWEIKVSHIHLALKKKKKKKAPKIFPELSLWTPSASQVTL